MARRPKARWRHEPDFAWIKERLRAFDQRIGPRGAVLAPMPAPAEAGTAQETGDVLEDEPNFARLSTRLGFSPSIVQGWWRNNKWPGADALIACATVFDEPWVLWMERGGFVLPEQRKPMTAPEHQMVALMAECPESDQDKLVQMVDQWVAWRKQGRDPDRAIPAEGALLDMADSPPDIQQRLADRFDDGEDRPAVDMSR